MKKSKIKKINVIITGATGMVGEGVLQESLMHESVGKVLVIGRRSCKIKHAKIKEIIIKDFSKLANFKEKLKGYNAVFFCLGTTSIGKSEKAYYETTYTLTIEAAKIFSRLNKGMIFCYVSGLGTDSSEKGKVMWARVKGKTENDLKKVGFEKVYLFRPGFMKSAEGSKNTPRFYKVIGGLYPVFKVLFPKYVSTLKEVGIAMINAVLYGYKKNILEVKDIVSAAEKK